MMSTSAGFTCFTVIPNRQETVWPVHPVEERDRVSLAMRFGDEPALLVSDADAPLNASSDRPWVLRSRFTLRGAQQSASFHLDRSLMAALREGDRIYIAQTVCGGLGVAVLRRRQLVASVGAVSVVPAGEGVQVRVAPELWEHGVASMWPEPGSNQDPRDKYRHEHPVQISIGGAQFLFFPSEPNRREHSHFRKARVLHACATQRSATIDAGPSRGV